MRRGLRIAVLSAAVSSLLNLLGTPAFSQLAISPGSPPDATLSPPTDRPPIVYSIPEPNRRIPLDPEMQTCATRLQFIHSAIRQYQKDNGRMPDWLSNLVPAYLEAPTLMCPCDHEYAWEKADPNLPCSFEYQFSPAAIDVAGVPTTVREWKSRQRSLFGDVVPVVVCKHHPTRWIGDTQRNVSIAMDGHVFVSGPSWEPLYIADYNDRMLFPGAFDKWIAPVEPAKVEVAEPVKPPVPVEYAQLPEDMALCAEHFRLINEAIRQFTQNNGSPPEWLSELVPGYIPTAALLCPHDPEHSAPANADPWMHCSYSYYLAAVPAPTERVGESAITYRDWRARQVEYFGDVVPTVRCHHHGYLTANLAAGGHIYWSRPVWEWTFKPDYHMGDELKEAPAQAVAASPPEPATAARPAAEVAAAPAAETPPTETAAASAPEQSPPAPSEPALSADPPQPETQSPATETSQSSTSEMEMWPLF